MAIVNKGFPGTVNATEYAKSWHLGGSDACTTGGWLVTQGTGRQTSTAAGDAFASGVLSTNSAPILTALSTPTNGQWFLIVRRIDWAGAGTVTVEAVAHSTTSTTIPALAPTTFPTINENPGVLYDHKLAWAWVRSTDTTMVLFDIREIALEPRLQVIETALAQVAVLNAGPGRSTGALFPTASIAALDAISTAVVGDIAQVSLPATGVDAILFHAVNGSGATIDWRPVDKIYAATKANLDTVTVSLTTSVDFRLRSSDIAFTADTGIIYKWNGSAWREWESDWITAIPTLTNITLGTGGVNQFRYRYSGELVNFEFYLLLGTGGVLTGAPAISLPVSSRALDHPGEQLNVGGSYFDVSAVGIFPVQMRFNGAAVNNVVLQNPTVAVNATSPFTWAAGDVMSIKGSYRAA